MRSLNKSKNLAALFLVSGLGLILGGCACLNTPEPEKETIDPYEPLNRAIFKLNKKADTYVIKPVATAYNKTLPDTIRGRVSNFFDNLRDITTSANDILQGKFGQFAHDASRFVINSTVGILGTFDPASHLGLEKNKEDFGQTLAVWGYENSAYLVLPLLGPSTVRDTAGMAVDFNALSIWPFIESDKAKYGLLGLDLLDIRAQLLKTEDVITSLAVDEYVFMRDAYLQRRKYLISDGKSAENLPNDITENDPEAPTDTKSESGAVTTTPSAEAFPGEGSEEIVQ